MNSQIREVVHISELVLERRSGKSLLGDLRGDLGLLVVRSEVLAHLEPAGLARILYTREALSDLLVVKNSGLLSKAPAGILGTQLSTSCILSGRISLRVDDDEALRTCKAMRLLPPVGISQHASGLLCRNLILDVTELLILIEVVLEFLKLEILLRQLLGSSDHSYLGVHRASMLRSQVRRSLRNLLRSADLDPHAPT